MPSRTVRFQSLSQHFMETTLTFFPLFSSVVFYDTTKISFYLFPLVYVCFAQLLLLLLTCCFYPGLFAQLSHFINFHQSLKVNYNHSHLQVLLIFTWLFSMYLKNKKLSLISFLPKLVSHSSFHISINKLPNLTSKF